MNASLGTPEAGLEAELIARGYERTDRFTDTGRFWRKRGVRTPPIPHVLIPHAIRGHYPDGMMDDIRRRIRLVNDWMHPQPAPDPDAMDC